MPLNRRFTRIVPTTVALLTVLCVTSVDARSVSETEAVSTPTAKLRGALKGSGSSFADLYYKTAIASFARTTKRVRIEYRPIGSGRGKAEFGRNVTDFAGTDSLVKGTDGPKVGEFLYIPTTAGAIAVAFHLNGVDDLNFSAPTLAKIFQRDIKRWNDPSIAAENPGVDLPNRAIGVLHRADRSGTTSNFTKFLDLAAPGVWRLGFGDSVRWPSDTSQGDGNRNVAQILANNNGSIGYVDLADARAFGLNTAAIRNKAGVFVRPTSDGVTAALSEVEFGDDLTYQPLDAAGASSYPLTAPTFVLVRTRYREPMTAQLVVAFLTHVLTDGQDLAVRANYARLPEPLRLQSLAQLAKITVS